ncbi:TIM barrel protein [uncultured Algoriphagus sp.]|uniref:TIM barrel protein n=1 Tax=uncultured Algoriphagus sp. TaxID=417365 RepID=UPI00258A5707|nr:TIM barrel protein [uncultured Algoriphagus sp.]
MLISKDIHQKSLSVLHEQLAAKGKSMDTLISQISKFQIAVPSWALGAGGTRFGRFSIGGEPRNLEEKLDDIALLSRITRKTDAVSLHIPWDIPRDVDALKQKAGDLGIGFDAMNSNTFQDYGQPRTYKLGSLSNSIKETREQAIQHNLQVIQLGEKLGSKGLTVWLADGTNFPGQSSFRNSLKWTIESLKEVYKNLPADWKLLLEYKPYEPNFYHTVIPDWGTSALICNELGEQAKVLVDLGHHLPNTNIEQIVATLMFKNELAGFHFNDSKYGDDDLTSGSIKPYQLFLIFCELISGAEEGSQNWDTISWMIDASHNTKDPLEDLVQALESISIAYTKALIVDRKKLTEHQLNGDTSSAQEILHDAFMTDVRPLVREARIRQGGEENPLDFLRKNNIRKGLIKERGKGSKASGL